MWNGFTTYSYPRSGPTRIQFMSANIESALGRPFHSADGQDVYPTIIEKAAALFHSLIANHPFHNGN